MNNSVLEYFLEKYMKDSTTATRKAQAIILFSFIM